MAAGVAVVAAGSTVARASGGPAAPDSLDFVARIEIGVPGTADARACTGVLVRPRVLVTARECVVSADHPDPAAGSALRITATFAGGDPLRVVDVHPDLTDDLSAVVLARPATVEPVPLGAAAQAGETLTAAGFGRTAHEWVPDQPHAVSFDVSAAAAGRVDLALDESSDAGLCRGDAGAPLLRESADGPELVAVATAAYQRGCFGETDTDGDAIAAPGVALASLPSATTDPFDQLTLSPTDSGTAPAEDAQFGAAVAAADFNKDGYADVAIGSPRGRTGSSGDVPSGTVTVFAGGANGPATGKRLVQTMFNASDEAGDRFGAALATGDFNKDGYMDLAVGTPDEEIGTIKAGAIAIFFGSASGLGSPKGIDQNDIGRTDLAGDRFGASLAAGDFNGDGITDLAVGAPGKVIGGRRSGEVTVLKGSTSGLKLGWIVDQSATNGANEEGDLFGESLAAGNVLGAKTGTVYSDLVIGVPGEAPGSNPRSGMVYVVPGSANGPTSGAIGITQSNSGTGANEDGDQVGAAVATADFNSDGWADVAIGVPGESPRSDPRAGSLTVVSGGSSAVSTGFYLEEVSVPGGDNQEGDRFGSVFGTGDFTGDGYADLLVGAPGRTGDAGRVYSFVGGPVSASRPNSLTPAGIIRQQDVFGTDEPGDLFGAALALGDLNKDGKADAVVGSPGEGAPSEPDAGMVTTLSRLTGTP
ncbi:trypsin-like serine protease [Mangrovihabitans endophyticus]|uniref:trypsin-like serine protease n=1 Tax=Mangrovihabitans endophyticus TaxID=1751298 RepID=UPI00166F211C|nr:trypsin-like serine protease [Mangrovihabitans endophyticus]